MLLHDIPLSYYKRFRMEADVLASLPPVPSLPVGYAWIPWNCSLVDQHADVKYQSFFEEIDAVIFANLSSRDGCQRLMRNISTKPGFTSDATWLIAYEGQFCGTIQGVRERSGVGAIQNVGVIAAHRGRGLGTALVLQSLHGFRNTGVHRVQLEVTVQNDGAIRLYRRLGFRCTKSIYKTVDTRAAVSSAGNGWFA